MTMTFVPYTFHPRNVVTKTTAYTAAAADSLINVTGTTTITLPVISTILASTAGLGGKIFKISNTGTAVVTIAAGTGNTVGGLSSITLRNNGDYAIVACEAVGTDWDILYPAPLMTYANIKDSTIPGSKMTNAGVGYSVSARTATTVAQNVFSASGAPAAMTITGIFVLSNDTYTGNVVIKNGTLTVDTIAKGVIVGANVGNNTMTNVTMVAGAVCTVESSTTGNAVVIINYTLT